MPLCSSPSGCCAAVRTPLHSPTTDAAVPPACALPPPPPVSGVLSSSLGELLSPSAQITILPQGCQHVVCPLHQQLPQILVSLFADVHLWRALARVPPPRL